MRCSGRAGLLGSLSLKHNIDNREPVFKGLCEARKEVTLLPMVDHIDLAMKDLSFEICSWMINCCKSERTYGPGACM
jgi:hypothetical protein